MGTIIIQASSLFFIIVLGFLLKRWNILTKGDGTTLSIIIVKITLPAVIILNLARLTLDTQLMIFILLGIIWSVVQVTLAWFLSNKQGRLHQRLMMFCTSGFNIGNFTLPFVQGFLPLGVPLLSMFDMGNSIMLCGGTKIVVDQITEKDETANWKKITRNLLSSIPFTSYIIMLFLRIFSIDLPTTFLTMLEPVAQANIFLSMFMIGLYLELRLPRTALKEVVKLLTIRYGVGIGVIVLIYFLPIAHLPKLVLALLAVTPIPLYAVINSVASGIKEEVVGFASSISFLISLPLMTVIMVIFNT